jgi:hypothetical protein
MYRNSSVFIHQFYERPEGRAFLVVVTDCPTDCRYFVNAGQKGPPTGSALRLGILPEKMFTNAHSTVRESTHFLLGRSTGETVSCGTAFIFVPGVLAAAAHVLYKEKGDSSSFQERMQVMRDPKININQRM